MNFTTRNILIISILVGLTVVTSFSCSDQASWRAIRSQLWKYELLIDHHDNCWLLTDSQGFYRYHIPSGKLTPFTGIPADAPRTIMEDHTGKIWMATRDAFAVYNYSGHQVRTIPYRLSARQTYSGRNYKLGLGEMADGYTKLPPGNYRLEVNASNISLIVPPWWQTGWAYGVYALLAAGMVVSFFHYRIRRIRLAQRMILQQQQTEQLKAIDEMKTRFFSNITHEFRTPLSLIISPIEKLQREIKDEQTSKTLSTIQGNANRLLQLINQLLDLSKLDAGSMQLNYCRGRLDHFIAEMVSLFWPLAERQQIGLTCQCSLTREYLFDADKLRTILFNLLSNALKFTPAGGKIAVTASEDEDSKIRISIRDTGIGIPADRLPFIFDRFYQADDSRIHTYEGTGIGLALVKELAQLMHGTVTAESRPNAGTSITLIFPSEKAGAGFAPPWQQEIAKSTVHLPYTRVARANGDTKQRPEKDAYSRPPAPHDPFLQNIYAIIDNMIDDSQLGASKLAEKNAMSLRTLNRKLNALIGLTAGDLIRQYRLQKSLVLLKEGRNVSEAAYMVGFETPAYFSQCFKDQYGVSPRDFTLI